MAPSCQGLKDSHDSSSPEPISFKIPGLKKVIGGAVQQSKAAVDKPAVAAPQQKVKPPLIECFCGRNVRDLHFCTGPGGDVLHYFDI